MNEIFSPATDDIAYVHNGPFIAFQHGTCADDEQGKLALQQRNGVYSVRRVIWYSRTLHLTVIHVTQRQLVIVSSMESTLKIRRKDTPALVQQPVLNFGDMKKAAAEMIIEDCEDGEDEEGGDGEEVEDHTSRRNQQREHTMGGASPTVPEHETKRGVQKQKHRQRKPTPVSTENHLVRRRYKGAFKSFPESVEEETAETERNRDRDPKGVEETSLSQDRGRKATPAYVANYTCAIAGQLQHLHADRIEEQEEDENDHATTTLSQNRGRKATPAVVTNHMCGIGEQFRQFHADNIEEETEEENDQDNTLPSSQETRQSQGRSRKATPAFVAGYTCGMAGQFQQLHADSIEEETEEDEEQNESNASSSVISSQETKLSQDTDRRATPAIMANYSCVVAGKFRQFQDDSIKEEAEEVKEHVTGDTNTCLAIPGDNNSEGSSSPKRKMSSVEVPSIEEINAAVNNLAVNKEPSNNLHSEDGTS